MELTIEQENAFISELTALTRKHNVVVSGCGCCGSPWLSAVAEKERDGSYSYTHQLRWEPHRDSQRKGVV